MDRHASRRLKKWMGSTARKPLIIRGARQVGKTHLVRQLGKYFESFVEINFEQSPGIGSLFNGELKASELVRNLGIFSESKINPGKTLLFLDEIQSAPRAITALRYLYEEIPELHVIAAGSLIDFALERVGVPVGRVEFMHLYPMSFMEFMQATGQQLLMESVMDHPITTPLPNWAHDKLLKHLAVYMAVGGMPEVVVSWINNEDLVSCRSIHNQIIQAYRQDFEKYGKTHQLKYLELIFAQIPRLLGKKFIFSHVSQDHKKAFP